MSKTVRIALIVAAVAIAAAYGVTLLIIQSIGPVM
jgi:hypothetical protein